MERSLDFAEYWGEYLKSNRLSYKKTAELCGISRTLVTKYAEGVQKPQNEETVVEIGRRLGMEKETLQELVNAYKISRYGRKVCVLADFLKKNNPERIYVKSNWDETWPFSAYDPKEGYEPSSGMQEQDQAMKCVQWFVRRSKYIRAMMQVDAMGDTMLSRTFLENKHCHVKQIMVLESNHSKDNVQDVNAAIGLLPVAFSLREYESYVLWGKIESEEHPYANIMLSESGILIFDSAFSEVFYDDCETYMDYYGELFHNMERQASPFIRTEKCAVGRNDDVSFRMMDRNRNKIYVEEVGLAKLLHSLRGDR